MNTNANSPAAWRAHLIELCNDHDIAVIFIKSKGNAHAHVLERSIRVPWMQHQSDYLTVLHEIAHIVRCDLRYRDTYPVVVQKQEHGAWIWAIEEARCQIDSYTIEKMMAWFRTYRPPDEMVFELVDAARARDTR